MPESTATRLKGALIAAALLSTVLGTKAQNTIPAAWLDTLNNVRAQGCEGRAGNRTALTGDPRLNAAAEQLAKGQALAPALAASAYRSVKTHAVTLRGYKGPTAVAQGVATTACSTLLSGELSHAGLYSQGDKAWVILAQAFAPPSPADEPAVQALVLTLVNQARSQPRQCGQRAFAAVGPLRLNAQLSTIAAGHAEDMARHGYFSHTGRDGSQPADRATGGGYTWRSVGENLAAGQMSAEEVVQGWLKSPGHCANLMQADFTEMGLAYAINLQAAAGIYWAQVFGRPR